MEVHGVKLPCSALISMRVLSAFHVKCFVLLFIALLNFKSLTIATSTSSGNETDLVSLLAFKSMIIHDPQSVLRLWNDSLHFCEWEGVTCGSKHKRVIALNLGSKGLVGSLSPYLGNLSFLRELRLPSNTIQGTIPPEIGRLFRLRVLNLTENSLEGEIPVNLSRCANLMTLNIGDNNLTGTLPVELTSLSMLITISVYGNNLEGGIPPSIGNLTSLEILSASGNMLGGSIPDSLGQLRKLTGLALDGNQLYGRIPPSIFNISSITKISLIQNQLHGTIPSDFGVNLPLLENFHIWGNHFSGSIPVSFSNTSKLKSIDVSMNNFTGKVKAHFEDLKQLVFLSLGDNSLGSGEADEFSFITSLANCSNLEIFDLSINQFKGVLPTSVGNLSTKLEMLIIGRNQIYGALPPGLGNLVSLTALGVEANQFSGTIPTEIGQLKNLQRVSFASNRFSGEIPSSFGNLSFVNELYLDLNELQGTIPSTLGSCQKLLLLSLSQNNLSGPIPKELFSISALSISLNLARNHLVGSLPSEIGNLVSLGELDISENKLSGEIPGDLGRCTSLENLYMFSNLFQGTLPSSVGSLKGLQNFDLSRNNFSGKIPEFLEKFSLKYLNLSFNNFEGGVPMEGIFTNVSAVSVEGNNRLCGGISKLQLPKCTIDVQNEQKKGKMSIVKVLLISIACALLVAAIVSSFLLCWFKKKKKERSSGSLLRDSVPQVSYGTLFKATDGFSRANLVGVGSFGSVYKGILDEAYVAVKVLNLQKRGAAKSFIAECEALRNIRHRNLVRVITSCSSIDFQGNDFKALVYEFMPNGSLEKWLHPVSDTNGEQVQILSLNLLQRVNIAIDVASALDYLHHQCQESIIHCDLKPSNVLLDSDMIAHVGDFGIARFLSQLTNPTQSSSIGVKGTIGYTAPEYGLGSEVSINGDVYSYGILLLEMMTGKSPTENVFEGGNNLHNFAKIDLPVRFVEIVDAVLLNDVEEIVDDNEHARQARNGSRVVECLISIIKIGVACSMESPQDRMDISNVLNELHKFREILLGTGIRSNRS